MELDQGFIFRPRQMPPTFRSHGADGSRRAVRGCYSSRFSCQVREGATRQLREARLWTGWCPGHDAHHTMNVNSILRPLNSKPVAGRGITMQAAGYNGSDVQCNYCKGVRHFVCDCTIIKVKEHQFGAYHVKHQRSQHAPCHIIGSGQVQQGGDSKKKWCSFHKATIHSLIVLLSRANLLSSVL